MIYTIDTLPSSETWSYLATLRLIYLPKNTYNITCTQSVGWLDFAISEYNIKIWAGYNEEKTRTGTITFTYDGKTYTCIITLNSFILSESSDNISQEGSTNVSPEEPSQEKPTQLKTEGSSTDSTLLEPSQELAGGSSSETSLLPPELLGNSLPGDNGLSDSSVYPSGATYSLSSGETVTENNKTFNCTTSDYNTVLVTKGTLILTDCALTKSGDTSSDGDNSSFYGVNSALFAGPETSTSNTAICNMTGGTITTNAKGANAVFTTRQGKVTINNVTINTTKDTSRGLHATYEGKITATNINITTEGLSCSTIATDRGGGYIFVTGGSATAKGTNSAVLYSTGTIEATNLTGISEIGEIAVVEGSNSVKITNCTMTSGATTRALMMLLSGSGDSSGANASISIYNSSLMVTNSSTPLCEVPTLNTGTLTLSDVTLSVPSNILMKVNYNTLWNTYGGTGNLILTTSENSKEYTGNVIADSYSNVTVTIEKNVIWNGCIDNSSTPKFSTITVNGTWKLTGNTTVTNLIVNSEGKVDKNGYTLNYTNITGSLT